MIDLEDPLGHVVEEVAIVGHGDNGAEVLGEVPFQPVHTLGIEVVRRLVEQEQVGLLEQQFAEGHAASLAAGEVRHPPVARRQVHGVHGDLDLPVQIPEIFGVDLVLNGRLLGEDFLHLPVRHRLA